MRIEKSGFCKLPFLSLLVFILFSPEVYSQTIVENILLNQETISLVETNENASYVNQESTNPVTRAFFASPFYINSPYYYYPTPFFYPVFLFAPFYYNSFFFSFGFSYYGYPFFFSYGYPFLYNYPFLFSPFAYNPYFFFPCRFYRYRYPYYYGYGKPHKKFKAVKNHANWERRFRKNSQGQLINSDGSDTGINPAISNRPTSNQTDFTRERIQNGVSPQNNSISGAWSRDGSNKTGFRSYESQGNGIPSNNNGSGSMASGNRSYSYYPANTPGSKFKGFRGSNTRGGINNSGPNMTSNSPFKMGNRGSPRTSNFSSGFKGKSFGRTGRTSFGRMGGSFKGFGRR
jgi:hypothetical protein